MNIKYNYNSAPGVYPSSMHTYTSENSFNVHNNIVRNSKTNKKPGNLKCSISGCINGC